MPTLLENVRFCATLCASLTLVQGLLPFRGMPTKRPVLRVLQAPGQARGRLLQRHVTAIVRKHVEEACERAWAEIAHRFGAPALLDSNMRSTASGQRASRALVTLLTNGLSRLMLAALMLPAKRQERRRRRWTAPVPKLAAIPGGLRRDGDTADDWQGIP